MSWSQGSNGLAYIDRAGELLADLLPCSSIGCEAQGPSQLAHDEFNEAINTGLGRYSIVKVVLEP